MSQTIEYVGRLAGAGGYACFVAALLLILRLHFIERVLGGLPRVYRLHHWLGAFSFLLLLLHPLLLSLSAHLISPAAGARLLMNLRDPIVLLGWISLTLLMLVMLMTFAIRLEYEVWRLTHIASGLSFGTATAHALMALTDAPGRFRVALGAAALGGGALSYWEIVRRVFRWRPAYSVTGTRRLAPNIVEIALSPNEAPLSFEPGQFIYVSFHDDPRGEHHCGVPREAHPFSIASPPEARELRLVVKALGDFTSALQGLEVGMLARVEGPYGRLFARALRQGREGRPLILLAGGIGIAPFLGFLSAKISESVRADLHHFVNSRPEAVFKDELRSLEGRRRGLRTFIHAADEEGLPSTAAIESGSGPAASWASIIICGPPAMERLVRRQLVRSGIPARRIRSETFHFT